MGTLDLDFNHLTSESAELNYTLTPLTSERYLESSYLPVTATHWYAGTLPPSWSALNSLKDLQLVLNRLTGEPFDTLIFLCILGSIDLCRSATSMVLIWGLCMTSVTISHQIAVYRAYGSNPPYAPNLRGRMLAVTGAQWCIGTLPPSWSGLSNLKSLQMFGNRLTGVSHKPTVRQKL